MQIPNSKASTQAQKGERPAAESFCFRPRELNWGSQGRVSRKPQNSTCARLTFFKSRLQSSPQPLHCALHPKYRTAQNGQANSVLKSPFADRPLECARTGHTPPVAGARKGNGNTPARRHAALALKGARTDVSMCIGVSVRSCCFGDAVCGPSGTFP